MDAAALSEGERESQIKVRKKRKKKNSSPLRAQQEAVKKQNRNQRKFRRV